MQILLVIAVFALMGGKSSPASTTPQQTIAPPAPTGSKDLQIVAGIVKTGLELFRDFMNNDTTP